MNRAGLEADFIDAPSGRLMVTYRRPAGGLPDASVLVVPAFAEEMNKSRPILRDLALELASRGRVLVIADLHGTGDSAGEFEDATLETWCDDLDAVADWLDDAGMPVRGCVAVRFGALLAGSWLSRSEIELATTVLWQPVTKGELIVNQWLRIRLASALFGDAGGESMASLKARISQGESIVAGGYRLPAAMLAQLGASSLDLTERMGQVHLLEVGSGDDCSPAARQLQSVHPSIRLARVGGEPFWTATEVVRNAALVRATADALLSGGS